MDRRERSSRAELGRGTRAAQERFERFERSAAIEVPIYLDPEIAGYLNERAQAKGVEVEQLINDMLRRDIALVEAVK